MGAQGQPELEAVSSPPERRRHRSLRGISIVWKLTLFVGVLVSLIGGALIAVAYVATDRILRNQIHVRLTTVATDRQKMLTSTLGQFEERAKRFARRNRIHELLLHRAQGRVSPEDFRREADNFLATAVATTAGVLALWLEDDAGRVIASAGPERLVAAYSPLDRDAESADGGLVVPPRRLGETFGMVFSAVIRERTSGVGLENPPLGRVMLLTDFGPMGGILMDPNGLGQTGEVLVGIGEGDKIRLVLPLRASSQVSEVTATEFPSLMKAIAGGFGFVRTTDHRGDDVLVSYRPVGLGYKDWGLIAKISSAEAYEPVDTLRSWLLALGGGALVVGLAASNLLARRFAGPIRRLARKSAAVAGGDYTVRSEVTSSDEIGALSAAFNRMTEELARSYTSLEGRIADRTRDLEAVRDLLDAFFRISTSRLDPHNIDRTFDSVLRFCTQLGYDHAMISLVDEDAGVIRAARATGTMTNLVELTVRPLEGGDILAAVARDGHVVVVPDSRLDARCDQAAIGVAGIRGQVVLPLASDRVLGTLQVASRAPIDPERLDLRPLETLASHTARALTGLRQLEEIRRLNQASEEHALELARSEAALLEQTQILQSVLDRMADGVIVADASARFLVFNPAAERILGHGRVDNPREDWSRYYEIFLPDRLTPCPVDDLPLSRAIRGESVDQAELFIAYPSRDEGKWILVNGRPLRDESGELRGGVVVFHDITRRKKSERRLAAQYEATRVLAEADSPAQASQKILETICEGLDWDHGGFWRVDPRSQRLKCTTIWQLPTLNAPQFTALTRELAFERGQGLPGSVWANDLAAWVPEIAEEPVAPRKGAAAADGLHAAFAVPVPLRGECLGVLEFFSREPRRPDPEILEMMNSLATQIGQHIERHQMRARVGQSEKLASLGLLSAGVAHEINNPLAYVATNLAVLDRDVRFLLSLLAIYERGGDSLAASHPDLVRQAERLADEFDLAFVKETMGKTLQSTRQGIKRVAEIVQNLRGFARLDRAEVDFADIHEAIHAAVEMLRGRMERRRIAIEEHLGEVPPVAGSPAQLNQVFMNLLVNAMQAIEATDRADGRILIRTGCSGGEITAEVADNGCGIAEDVLPQIFDPFFTTKATGDGTGLGLSITHSLVQDHGGRLEVESVAGQGTRFRVLLPAARGSSRLAVDGIGERG